MNASDFLMRSGFSEAYYRVTNKCQSHKAFFYTLPTLVTLLYFLENKFDTSEATSCTQNKIYLYFSSILFPRSETSEQNGKFCLFHPDHDFT